MKMDAKNLQNLASDVEYQSYRSGINPKLFRLTLQCLVRAPFASYRKADEFIQMIHCLLQAGYDYTLLLKAGILAGQFPDYRAYKRKKAKEFRKTKEETIVDQQLEELKAQLGNPDAFISQHMLWIPVDIRWLDKLHTTFLRAVQDKNAEKEYRAIWKSLVREQRNIAEPISPDHFPKAGYDDSIFSSIIGNLREVKQKEIQEELNLNVSEWSCASHYAFDRLTILISKAVNSNKEIIKRKDKNQYDFDIGHPNLFGTQYLFINDFYETEELKFVSIFQNHIFSGNGDFYPVKKKLEDYFIETHRGRTPQKQELDVLLRRFYRFINKAYPKWEATTEILTEMGKNSKGHVLTTMWLNRRDAFYLFHGNPKKDDKASLHRNAGTLIYDLKQNKYYLCPGSQLSDNIDDIDDVGISEFIEVNMKQGKICRLPEGKGYRVLKKIAISSPSKAAWLVCGYKRNGLDCWENIKHETLRQYLTSKGILANSKSVSTQPPNQEGHQDADSVTPTPH